MNYVLSPQHVYVETPTPLGWHLKVGPLGGHQVMRVEAS